MELSKEISVIIPMYNSSRTIIRALESVCKQSFDGNIEVIIVNDGSTDNSLSLVQSYKPKKNTIIIKVINKINGGVSSARNAGIKVASSKWIAFLDSDDEWLPFKLEKQWNVIKNRDDIDFLGCNLVGQEINLLWHRKELNQIKIWEQFIKVYPQTSTVIVKKDALNDVGLYNEMMRYGEDVNLWIKLLSKKKCYFQKESLVLYDGGKIGFTGGGLAANLKKMHEGEIYNLNYSRKESLINDFCYIIFYSFIKIKYYRRILISKITK